MSGNALTGIDGHDYAANNQIYRGGLTLQKADYEMKQPVTQGVASLEGAEFVVINASKTSVRNKDDVDIPAASVSEHPTYDELRAIADAGTNVVQRLVTDAKGRASTGAQDLPYGTYYVIETKAGYGYWIDTNFVGKAVIREDKVNVRLGTAAAGENQSSFVHTTAVAAEKSRKRFFVFSCCVVDFVQRSGYTVQ